jgi:tRNA-splicing endonuclease subunit Sen15
MAPSATTGPPPTSALEEYIHASKSAVEASQHPAYLHHLASNILHNLQYQHDWTSLAIHTHSLLTNELLPRPIVSGRPPKRAYIHPDEQVAILKAEHETGKQVEQVPELEWVLPTHWEEKWSLAKFAAIFDALATVPLSEEALERNNGEEEDVTLNVCYHWRGANRQKRLLLATLHDDSTVIYYIMHDGIVKPRQN